MTQNSSVALLAPTPTPGDDSAAFWKHVYGGLVALSRCNLWVSAVRLRQIARETLFPDAIRALGLPPQGRTLANPHDERLALMVGQWGVANEPADVGALADAAGRAADLTRAYAALCDDYQRIGAQLRLPTPPDNESQRKAMELLTFLQEQPPTPSPEALLWPTLSIVLPAYNEEMVITRTARACVETVARFCPNAEIIIVNDGSRDNTGPLIDGLAQEDAAIIPLHHRVNRGYGAAVLTGFAAARGMFLFFMDSDGQFAIEDIEALLKEELRQPGIIVLGYRRHRQDTLLRRLNAWGWKRLVRLVIGLDGVRDIDCAFKLFPTALVRACNVTAQGAMVNTELLIKLKHMGAPMIEVPVRHFPRIHGSATGANLRVIARAFQELLRLRLRLHQWRAPAAYPEAALADVRAALAGE
ncbi:MAG TPA: glycosyltransferase family 2 protein [Ktedonobacterales bacterium]|nr:glycosyltransferase family 2 protein [Ktedonobacterales bacterium]